MESQNGSQKRYRPIDSSKCRICLSEEHLKPLFRHGLSMKLMKLAEIKIYEGDGLPAAICLNCEIELVRSFNFVNQIKSTDAQLRELIAEEETFLEAYSRYNVSSNKPETVTSTSQEVQMKIEEYNVKPEELMMADLIDEKNFDHFEENNDSYEEEIIDDHTHEAENNLNPIDHVDVIENANNVEAMDVSGDPLGQEEPLIESQNYDENIGLDPLTYKKEEPASMIVNENVEQTATYDTAIPSTSGASESVTEFKPSVSLALCPKTVDNTKIRLVKTTLLPLQYKLVLLNNKPIVGQPITPILSSNVSQGFSRSIDITKRSTSNKSQFLLTTPKINLPTVNKPKKIEKLPNKGLKTLVEEVKDNWLKNKSFCIVCNVDCENEELLAEHKENNSCFCRVCTLEFKSHKELEDHFITHKTFKCNACTTICFSLKDIKVHKNEKHESTRKKCEECGKTFSQAKTLRNHMSVEHLLTSIKNYKCVVCEKVFKRQWHLNGHLVKVHHAFESQECKLCKVILSGLHQLKHHMKHVHIKEKDTEELIACQVCGKLLKGTYSLKIHQKQHDNTQCLCHLCGTSVTGELAMSKHMDEKHPMNSYPCKYCGEQLPSKLKRRSHYQQCPKKSHKTGFCEICGKVFKSLSILKFHKQIHNEERPFKCDQCDATFKQAVTLNTHKRVHSNVGKFYCTECGLNFKWKKTYKNHINKCGKD